MNKKGQVYILAAIVVIALIAFFFFRLTAPDEDANRADVGADIVAGIGDEVGFDGVRDPIDTTKSHVSFEGFGPGKSHLGKFNEWSGDLYIEDGKIIGFDGTIQADSVETEIGAVTNHLKTADFFNVEKYPTIKFKSKNIENNELTGYLTFLGVTKEITFPVAVNDDSISADFVLDSSQFRDKESETAKSSWLFKANDEVRIYFKLVK